MMPAMNAARTLNRASRSDITARVQSAGPNRASTRAPASLPARGPARAIQAMEAEAPTSEPNETQWLGNALRNVTRVPPNMITIGQQKMEEYGFKHLLRFRWFGVNGPSEKPVTLAMNLHRGPKYAGMGHAWAFYKINPHDEEPVWKIEENPKTLLSQQECLALIRQLERYATAWTGKDAEAIRRYANNANCGGTEQTRWY